MCLLCSAPCSVRYLTHCDGCVPVHLRSTTTLPAGSKPLLATATPQPISTKRYDPDFSLAVTHPPAALPGESCLTVPLGWLNEASTF